MRRQNRKYTEYEVKIRLFLIKYVPLQYTILLIQRKKNHPWQEKNILLSGQNKIRKVQLKTKLFIILACQVIPSPPPVVYFTT